MREASGPAGRSQGHGRTRAARIAGVGTERRVARVEQAHALKQRNFQELRYVPIRGCSAGLESSRTSGCERATRGFRRREYVLNIDYRPEAGIENGPPSLQIVVPVGPRWRLSFVITLSHRSACPIISFAI